MFCKNCGNKIEEGSKFCSSCGTENSQKDINLPEDSTKEEVIFYSTGWPRRDGFRGNQPPTYDIAITSNFFYLIKLPNSNLAEDILLQIPTGLIGALYKIPMGNKIEKLINNFRLSGFDPILKKRFLNDEYRKNIFIQIQKEKIKTSITFKLNKQLLGTEEVVIINYGDKKITISPEKKEDFDILKKYIELQN